MGRREDANEQQTVKDRSRDWSLRHNPCSPAYTSCENMLRDFNACATLRFRVCRSFTKSSSSQIATDGHRFAPHLLRATLPNPQTDSWPARRANQQNLSSPSHKNIPLNPSGKSKV